VAAFFPERPEPVEWIEATTVEGIRRRYDSRGPSTGSGAERAAAFMDRDRGSRRSVARAYLRAATRAVRVAVPCVSRTR
jgi:hypothetical protein